MRCTIPVLLITLTVACGCDMSRFREEEEKREKEAALRRIAERSKNTARKAETPDFNPDTLVVAKAGPFEGKAWASGSLYRPWSGIDLALEVTYAGKDRPPLLGDKVDLSLYEASSGKRLRHRVVPSAFEEVNREGSNAAWHMIIEDAFHSDLRELYLKADSEGLPEGHYTISVELPMPSGGVLTIAGLKIEVRNDPVD